MKVDPEKQIGIRHEPPEKISKLEGDQSGERKGLGEATTAASGELMWTLQAPASI